MRNTETLRIKARQAVIAAVPDAATHQHRPNYHKLLIERDGTANWTEFLNKWEDLIDSDAYGFAAVPSVACVGTGAVVCNCEHCNDVYNAVDEARAIEEGREYDRSEKYATAEEAISDAVANSDLDSLEIDMLAEFEAIPLGYFDDEEGEGESSMTRHAGVQSVR